MHALFQVKLLALVGQFADLLRWNFPYALFSGSIQSNISLLFLIVAGSEILYSKAFLSNTRKGSQSLFSLQTWFRENIENVQGKCQCRCCTSVMWLYQIRTPPWIFFNKCSYLFWDLYLIFICHQIIIVLIGLHSGSCRSVIGEITVTALRTPVKSDNDL